MALLVALVAAAPGGIRRAARAHVVVDFLLLAFKGGHRRRLEFAGNALPLHVLLRGHGGKGDVAQDHGFVRSDHAHLVGGAIGDATLVLQEPSNAGGLLAG